MANPLDRWERHVVVPLLPNTVLPLNQGDAFYIKGWANIPASFGGVYLVKSPTPIALRATTGANGLAQLISLMEGATALIIKLDGNAPAGVNVTDTDARIGALRPWVSGKRYSIGDIIVPPPDLTSVQVFAVSLLDNNIQTVFSYRWEAGAITPPNQLNGLFTVPIGGEFHMDHSPATPRKVPGAMYYARDTKTLWVADTAGWNRIRGQDIPNYDKNLDETEVPYPNPMPDPPPPKYRLGDVVFGHLKGRYADSDWVIEAWGIFRRDDVRIWDIFNPVYVPLNTPTSVGVASYFYIKDLTGANAIYNGIYRSDIMSSIEISNADVSDVSNHLEAGNGYVPLTPPPKPNITIPILMQEWAPNHVYNRNDYVFVAGNYSEFYRCNYNHYKSPAQFNKDDLSRGWTCLADLDSTIDYPYRQSCYIHYERRVDFPNPPDLGVVPEDGINTIYLASDTGRLYYWDRGQNKYRHFSEDYPYVEAWWGEAYTPNPLDPTTAYIRGGAIDIKWNVRWSEFETDTKHYRSRFYSGDKRFQVKLEPDLPTPSDYTETTKFTYKFSDDFRYTENLMAGAMPTPLPAGAVTQALEFKWDEKVNQDHQRNRIVDILTKDTRLPFAIITSGTDADDATLTVQLMVDLAMTYIRSWKVENTKVDATATTPATFTVGFTWNEKPATDDTDAANPTDKTNQYTFKSGDKRFILTPSVDSTTNNGNVVFTFDLTYIVGVSHTTTGVPVTQQPSIDTTKPVLSTVPGSLTMTGKTQWKNQADQDTVVTTADTTVEKLLSVDDRLKATPSVATTQDADSQPVTTGTMQLELNFPYIKRLYGNLGEAPISTPLRTAGGDGDGALIQISAVDVTGDATTYAEKSPVTNVRFVPTPEIGIKHELSYDTSVPAAERQQIEITFESQFVQFDISTLPNPQAPASPDHPEIHITGSLEVESDVDARIVEFKMSVSTVLDTPVTKDDGLIRIPILEHTVSSNVGALLNGLRIPVAFFDANSLVYGESRGSGWVTVFLNTMELGLEVNNSIDGVFGFNYINGQPEQAESTNASINPQLVVTKAGLLKKVGNNPLVQADTVITDVYTSARTGVPAPELFLWTFTDPYDTTVYSGIVDNPTFAKQYFKDNIPGAPRRYYKLLNNPVIDLNAYRRNRPGCKMVDHFSISREMGVRRPPAQYQNGQFVFNSLTQSYWIMLNGAWTEATVDPELYIHNPQYIIDPVTTDGKWATLADLEAAHTASVNGAFAWVDDDQDATSPEARWVDYVTGVGWVRSTMQDFNVPPYAKEVANPSNMGQEDVSLVDDIETQINGAGIVVAQGEYVTNLASFTPGGLGMAGYQTYIYDGFSWALGVLDTSSLEDVFLSLQASNPVYILSANLDSTMIEVHENVAYPFLAIPTAIERITSIIPGDYLETALNNAGPNAKEITLDIYAQYEPVYPDPTPTNP